MNRTLLVLENDSEHMGLPDMLQRVLNYNQGCKIDPWFWFSEDVRQNPAQSFARFAKASADPNTWCVTYPSFVGYGNTFEGKLHLFQKLMEQGIKVRIYVINYPDFYWFLVGWMHDTGCAVGAHKVKEKEIELFKQVLVFHEIYSASYMDLTRTENSLEKHMVRVTWERLEPNYYPYRSKLKIKATGVKVEFAGFNTRNMGSKDVPEISVLERLPSGGYTLKYYPQTELKRVSVKKRKVKEPAKPKEFDITKGRLTSARMVEWLNMQFAKLEIKDYVVTKVEPTRFSQNQIEGGACRLRVHFQHAEKEDWEGTFMCFYSLKEYEDHMKMGFEMYVKFGKRGGSSTSISDLEVDLRKRRDQSPK